LIDDQAGAGVRGDIDMALQSLTFGNFTRIVMVGIKNSCTPVECSNQCVTILIQRHIKHRDLVTRCNVHSLQQIDVALESADALRLSWVLQA